MFLVLQRRAVACCLARVFVLARSSTRTKTLVYSLSALCMARSLAHSLTPTRFVSLSPPNTDGWLNKLLVQKELKRPPHRSQKANGQRHRVLRCARRRQQHGPERVCCFATRPSIQRVALRDERVLIVDLNCMNFVL